jgi:hypothetical protein
MEPQSILSEMGKKLLVVNNYKFGKLTCSNVEKYVGDVFKERVVLKFIRGMMK